MQLHEHIDAGELDLSKVEAWVLWLVPTLRKCTTPHYIDVSACVSLSPTPLSALHLVIGSDINDALRHYSFPWRVREIWPLNTTEHSGSKTVFVGAFRIVLDDIGLVSLVEDF